MVKTPYCYNQKFSFESAQDISMTVFYDKPYVYLVVEAAFSSRQQIDVCAYVEFILLTFFSSNRNG